MSLKKFHYKKGTEMCLTCKFIDEYTLNDADEGEAPVCWNGDALCSIRDISQPLSDDNRLFVSPYSVKCPKYERCTERQADYLDIYCPEEGKVVPNPNDHSKVE